jgi:hypothetical protein
MSNCFNVNELKHLIKDGNKLIISNGNIYNVTLYHKDHPGGEKAILKKCLKIKSDQLIITECEKDWGFHSKSGKKEWEKCKIGLIETYKSKKKSTSWCKWLW